jgi:O-methyltransferase
MTRSDDLIICILGVLGLKAPVKRWLASAPEWIARLNTRDIRTRPRLVDEDRLQARFTEAIALLESNGVPIEDYLEFGVYNGTSLACMHRVMAASNNRHSRLIGFDSFEGLPPIAASDSGGHWRPGEFKSSLEFARRVLDHERVDWSRVVLVKGYFDTTLTEHRRADLRIRRASIIMIDCDLYQSTKEALQFCGPAIVDQSVIFFDDWYPLARKGLGERMAFEEWLAADATLHARELFDVPCYGKAFLVERSARPN